MDQIQSETQVIVSQARSFIFIHIPKNGGRDFRDFIAKYHDYPEEFWWIKKTNYLGVPLDHAHLRSWEVRLFYPRVWELMSEARTFCFFRNPAERFVSAIYEHFRQFRPEVNLGGLAWTDQRDIARGFTRSLNLQDAYWNPTLIHFSPQTWFTHLDESRVVREIIPLAGNSDSFRTAASLLKLGHIDVAEKTASTRYPGDLLGHELLQRVRDWYEADYAFCSQTKELQSLTG